jgi:hypothetical protein
LGVIPRDPVRIEVVECTTNPVPLRLDDAARETGLEREPAHDFQIVGK